MFTAEFLTEAVARAGRRKTQGAQRCRTVLGCLAAGDAVRERMRLILAEHGSTEQGFEVLTALRLAEDGRLAPAVMAERTGMLRATLSSHLACLEAAGFIVRRRHPSDGRQLLAALTPRGRAHCDALIEHYVSALLEIVDELPSSLIPSIAQTLGTIRRRAAATSSFPHER